MPTPSCSGGGKVSGLNDARRPGTGTSSAACMRKIGRGGAVCWVGCGPGGAGWGAATPEAIAAGTGGGTAERIGAACG